MLSVRACEILLMNYVTTAEIIDFLDIIGTIACATAGTLMAKRNSADILGAIFISAVAAVGGGTVRDILLDKHPIFWMTQSKYLIAVVVTSLLVQVFLKRIEKLDKPLLLFDAAGAATFAVIGIEKGISVQADPMVSVLMGITTATVGGILRDIICNKIPLVFKREVYITACLAGAICYFALLPLQLPSGLHQLLIITIIFSIRMLAIYRNWQLPDITLK